MNVAELISNSFYLSGIVARGLQTVTGEQTSDGLTILNDILAEMNTTSNFILYYSHTTFNTVAGQSEYVIDDLVDLTQLTFNINDVRFEMERDTQYTFFGQGRVDNLRSLPFHYYAERHTDGTKIYLYFVPDAVYQMNITGKYGLNDVTLTQDLTDVFDRFYLSYLKHLLAKRLCDFYGEQLNESVLGTLQALESKIDRMVGVDLSIRRKSMFDKHGFNYAQANFKNGWDVP